MSEQNMEDKLFEKLMKTYPVQTVNPYGQVVIVPARNFKEEWMPLLNVEGIKVVMGDLNKQSCFFLHKTEQKAHALHVEQTQDMANDPPSEEQTDKRMLAENISAEPKHMRAKHTHKAWTDNDLETLKKLRDEGVSNVEIAEKLGRTLPSIEGRLRYYKKTHEKPELGTSEQYEAPESKAEASPTSKNVRLIETRQDVKEHLESALLLIGSNKVKSTVLLLREINRLLESEEAKET